MGKCRINSLAPSCGYNTKGIESIRLLDFDDFGGFIFDDDGLYNSCYVSEVLQRGNSSYVDLAAPESANYSSAFNNGIYTHAVETFIGDLSASLSASLHLATKKRYIVLFRTKSGRYFIFGYEAGAKVTYTNQTDEAVGSVISLSANSIYPLFEKSPATIGQYITAIPNRIIIEKPDILKTFSLMSSSPWRLISGPTQYIQFDTTQGGAGSFKITITALTTGQGYFIFRNETGQTLTLYIATVDDRVWILEDRVWNMLGFWYDIGIWKF